ncbi:sigma factor-like helix-turn-helix DNA-binding protein [Microbacterium sp. LWH12-1.2]|uniref:sigma factor-like helix-turn-helix DNA-binding protein n=1 Tax=Microbacterium sp. LWH12-1.2 TaxID=3135259 RepID=UPI0034329197
MKPRTDELPPAGRSRGDGFTLAEAADVLGIPSSTARGRYPRAREQLRAAL